MGEQIDGSFELDGYTYLVEAKWHSLTAGARNPRSLDNCQNKPVFAQPIRESGAGNTAS